MTYQQIQDRIVSNFWSEGLKRRLAELDYRFPEQDLLGLAYQYAPSFAGRLELLELLAQHVPPVADQARRCVLWQRVTLEDFQRPEDGVIYELTIKLTPDSYPERYLCADYPACLEMIDKFLERYEEEEQEDTRYRITKRKIFHSGDEFREDELGECVLLRGKVVLSADVNDERTEVCGPGKNCVKCQTLSAHCIQVCYPGFLPDRCAVRYRMPNGSIRFGVHLGGEDGYDRCYIIPLDGELLSSRDHAAHWGYHWHEHIPHPYVEQMDPEDLDPQLRENYEAFLAFLNSPGAPDIIRNQE